MQAKKPLVSVITPVYNGDRYIAECIESVRAQTYNNWIYTVVDNQSNDNTSKIVNDYLALDERIKYVKNEQHLPIIQNWNNSLKAMDKDARYCKMVHADDCLFPECIEKMVELAEEDSSIAIVGAYVLRGTRVNVAGVPYQDRIISGKEIGRLYLERKQGFLFGSPTSVLYRKEIIPSNNKLYNEDFLQADAELCLSILQDHNYGFVHQVLSYAREHQKSVSKSYADPHDTWLLEHIAMLIQHGERYLSAAELSRLLEARMDLYYKNLARSLFRSNISEILSFHSKKHKLHKIPFKQQKLAYAFISLACDNIFNPKRTLEKLLLKHSSDAGF